MIPSNRPSEIRMISVDQIDVLNTRERNKKVFEEVVGNIKAIGLKKPITVTPRKVGKSILRGKSGATERI